MNKMFVKFSATSQNEAFARTCIIGFLFPLNLSLSEISDIKTAVSPTLGVGGLFTPKQGLC